MEGQPPIYADTLRDAIKHAKTSRTKLSFDFAEKTGNKQKSEYRALGKYLSGEETPDPERAAILAVLLKEPRLALVTPVADRRRGRQAELEERVADLERALNTLGPDLGALASLPERVRSLEQQAQPKTGRGG